MYAAVFSQDNTEPQTVNNKIKVKGDFSYWEMLTEQTHVQP